MRILRGAVFGLIIGKQGGTSVNFHKSYEEVFLCIQSFSGIQKIGGPLNHCCFSRIIELT